MCLSGTSESLLSTFFQKDETQLRDDKNDVQQGEGYEMMCVFFIKHFYFVGVNKGKIIVWLMKRHDIMA